jgi:Ca2+-binding RTX toxin-like protein
MKKIKNHTRFLNIYYTKNYLVNIFCLRFFTLFLIVSLFLITTAGIFTHYDHSNIIIDVWGITGTINGTESADNITGTANKDYINGLNGNDNLIGKEAGDDISGGSGNDTIYGNDGRDVLWGKSGDDHIDGEKGNDRLYGGRGNDVIVGGPGNDTITGGIGKDVFICGTGKDILRDLNETQGDTIPQNDCENSKYNKTGDLVSLQQQQNLDPKNINNAITEKSNPKSEKDKRLDKDGGFFFGLFK